MKNKKRVFEELLSKKQKYKELNKEILERHKKIYDLFVKASKKEEFQEIERWLLR